MGLFDRKPNIEKMEAKRDVKGLIKALKDWRVVDEAAYVLGEIGDKRAVEPLIKALEDEDRNVRWGAAEALGYIGDKRAVEPLIKALEDEDWYVRKRAAYALGDIGDKRAVEPLTEALKDDEEEVREAAECNLGKFKAKRSTKKKPEKKEEREKGVKFVEMKYSDEGHTYEVYTAESKEQAWEFIKTKSVNKKYYYIEVNVGDVNDPEVIVGLDIQGTYEM